MRSVNTTELRNHLHYYTNFSHPAGSPRDKETAVYTKDKWTEYGIATRIETLKVKLAAGSTNNFSFHSNRSCSRIPKTTRCNCTIATHTLCWRKSLWTNPLRRITKRIRPFGTHVRWPQRQRRQVVTFLFADSGTGVVTAPLVYANYGHETDFEKVKALVNGSIAIVRYGQGFRGNKVTQTTSRASALMAPLLGVGRRKVRRGGRADLFGSV